MFARIRTAAVWGLFGVLATLVGIAAGHLVSALLVPSSSPVLAVGSAVIDATPTPMKEWAIRNFGSKDKTILVGSVLIVVLLLSAVAGLLARRRFRNGAILQVVLVAVAAYAAITRPTAGAEDLVPSLVTAAAGVAALGVLARLAHGRRTASVPGAPTGPLAAEDRLESPVESPVATAAGASRRGVLIGAGVLAVLAAAMGEAGRAIRSFRARPEDITLPAAADPAPALPVGLDDKIPGISPLKTPNKDFYRVDTRLDTPVLSAADWTLRIDGDVENELTFTFDDLLDMELIERDITMTCVSNSVGGPYLGSATWLGVRLTDLLDRAKVGTKADQILSTDFDGMKISTPLDLATDGRDAMIAIGMNGEPLPRAHGFPARMIVPGLYGFISGTKWVTRLTLTTYAEETAYWTDRKWATDAPIKMSSRIDTPRALSQIDAGKQFIGGVAWAQQAGGIAKVQVRIDGGAWTDATLGPDVNNDYWRQWYYEWDAKPGRHSLAVRAVSGEGEVQSAVRADPFPSGSSGIQDIFVTVG
ncbi:molybdopterin-dependent oxidoreductase [Nocardioides fonticola]